MPMGDELSSAFVHMSTTVIQSGISTVSNLIAEILRMMRSSADHRRRMQEARLKSGINISDLKPGTVKIKDLINDAKKSGDSVSSPANGYSKEDAQKIAAISKKYGIPVAFTERGDNVYAHVRSCDVPLFRRVLDDAMHDKLARHTQDVSNFRVNAWEIPYITSELNNFGLNASFGQTKSGDYFCLYDKADEKAILIARGEFVKKYNEVKKEFMTDRDEEGFYTLKDIRTGKEISFDDTKKSCQEISEELQKTFGYDKNKADIAAAKFGEECLEGEVKENYFDNPQNRTHSIINNIALETDDVYAQQYTCMRVVPKDDSIQRIVFSDKDGRFAVLSPEMKRSEMEEELKYQLSITDRKEMDSLIEKAENVMLYYALQEDQTRYFSEYTFNKNDFDMTNPDVVAGMKREADNQIFTRDVPLDNLNVEIERNGKHEFTVTSVAGHNEINENKEYSVFRDTRTARLSFSDKKKAIHELQMMFESQGVPEGMAKRAANDAFAKAESQETEKVIYLEEVKSENPVYYSDNLKVEADIYCAGKKATVDISNADIGKQQLIDEFGLSKEQADGMFGNASDKLTDRQHSLLKKYGYDCEDWSVGEASYVIDKISENGWNIPEGMEPEKFSIDSFREISNLNTEKAPLLKTPDVEIDTEEIEDFVSMGGR